jgi:hypothetical protein
MLRILIAIVAKLADRGNARLSSLAGVPPPKDQAHDEAKADGADDKWASEWDGNPRENDQSNGDNSAGTRTGHAEPAVSANVAWFA